MSQVHLDRTISIASLPTSSYSCSGSATPSSDISSPSSCPPTPSHQHHIFTADIGSSSQDSVLRGTKYPYHTGALQTKHLAGWNSVDTFEIREGNSQKAVLISPSKFKFKLSRSTSPASPTKSIHKRAASCDQEQREAMCDIKLDGDQPPDRGVVRERVSLVDQPVSPVGSEEARLQQEEGAVSSHNSSTFRVDQCVTTPCGSRYREVSRSKALAGCLSLIPLCNVQNLDYDVTAAEMTAFLQITSPNCSPHAVNRHHSQLRSVRAQPAKPFIRITSPLSSEAESPTEASSQRDKTARIYINKARSRRMSRGSQATRPRTMFGWAASQEPPFVPVAGPSSPLRPASASRSNTTDAVLTIADIRSELTPRPQASPVEDRRFSISGAFYRPRPSSMVSTSSSISSGGRLACGDQHQHGEHKQQKRPISGLFRRMSSSHSNKATACKPILLPSPREEEEQFEFTSSGAKANLGGIQAHGGLEPQLGWKRFMRKIISPNDQQDIPSIESRAGSQSVGAKNQEPGEYGTADLALDERSLAGHPAINESTDCASRISWSVDGIPLEAPSSGVGPIISLSEDGTVKAP